MIEFTPCIVYLVCQSNQWIGCTHNNLKLKKWGDGSWRNRSTLILYEKSFASKVWQPIFEYTWLCSLIYWLLHWRLKRWKFFIMTGEVVFYDVLGMSFYLNVTFIWVICMWLYVFAGNRCSWRQLYLSCSSPPWWTEADWVLLWASRAAYPGA